MSAPNIFDLQINKASFKVDSSFSPEYWCDIKSGNWEAHTFEIIDYFVDQTSVALDIGCWAGPLSLYMATKGAQVFCVEPDPVAYRALINNLGLNPNLKQNIHAFRLAIAVHEGTLNLFARKSYGQSSTSLLNRSRDHMASATARGCPLANFVRIANISKIDFIKIDIEGGEFAIVDDLIKTIEKYHIPTLYLSLHFAQLNESIYKNKIGIRPISLMLLKLEKYFRFRLFSNVLQSHASAIINLARRYQYAYNQFGDEIPATGLTVGYLLSTEVDLLLSNRSWKK